MWKEALPYLVDPDTKEVLTLKITKEESDGWIEEGVLENTKNGNIFKIVGGVPRFIESDKYTKSFSKEWSFFRHTLLNNRLKELADPIKYEDKLGTEACFFKHNLGMSVADLKGKDVLDIGCGSGFRSLYTANCNAKNVFAVDMSFAVDVAKENCRQKRNCHIIQADLHMLPFREESFDFIFSVGVLHHTPDIRKSFHVVSKFPKIGGRLSLYLYAELDGIKCVNRPLRMIMSRMPYWVVMIFSFLLIPYGELVVQSGRFKRFFLLFLFVPTNKNWKERFLNTFDWYTPRFQHYTHYQTVSWWFVCEGYQVDINNWTISGVRGRIIPPGFFNRYVFEKK